jgi:hypothetical protein
MTAATSSNTMLTSVPPPLVPLLKTLRLGGIQDTLPLRLDEAQQQCLGYLEFLELLLSDEIQRRANRALASRLSKAQDVVTLHALNQDAAGTPLRLGTRVSPRAAI